MKLAELKTLTTPGGENSKAKQIAAEFLDTVPGDLVVVSGSAEEKVLDTGKEIRTKAIEMAGGKFFVRLFKAFGDMFARVEGPDSNIMYQAKPAMQEDLTAGGALKPVKHLISLASVAADRANKTDLGVVGLSIGQKQSRGITSKSTPPMPKYKTIPSNKQGTM